MERLHYSYSDRKRVDAFLRRRKRYGFCPLDLEPFTDLIEIQENQLFSAINHNPHHLLCQTVPAMLNYAGKAGEAGKAGNGDTAPLQLTIAQNMSALIINCSK